MPISRPCTACSSGWRTSDLRFSRSISSRRSREATSRLMRHGGSRVPAVTISTQAVSLVRKENSKAYGPGLPSARPLTAPPYFHVLAKPTGPICNLDCEYCFFLSKEMLYPGDRFRMSDQLLDAYIRQLLEAQPEGEVNVAWQGGEPTLMGLDFFKRAIVYVVKYQKPGQRILHTMQTNGTLLNDEWCAFFKEHNFLIGLSVDGPKQMHDAYRVNKGGAGSFDQVMRGWETLHRHKVD